ncbi:MAG: GlsB/YeaQ/YmgE family stress response membrane protein [Lautropia sp.]
MGNILVMILVGFVVGLIARALMPGDQKMGVILTTLLGIAGSAVANWSGAALGWYRPGASAGWIASIVGALIVLFVYGLLSKNKG